MFMTQTGKPVVYTRSDGVQQSWQRLHESIGEQNETLGGVLHTATSRGDGVRLSQGLRDRRHETVVRPLGELFDGRPLYEACGSGTTGTD